MTSWYNEIDPEAAQVLRNLIAAGVIPPGVVDERDVREVKPDEIRHYTQCHFFAGGGGWSIALARAGYPCTRSVWTASAPCQPFSAAGQGRGQQDERHLWPYIDRLIGECRPAKVYGEQVANAVGKGWFDDVANGLEEKAYAVAAAVLRACALEDGFHERARLYFVADGDGVREQQPGGNVSEGGRWACDGSKEGGTMADHTRQRLPGSADAKEQTGLSRLGADDIAMGNGIGAGLEGYAGHGEAAAGRDTRPPRSITPADSIEWVMCDDGRLRAIKPGIRLLANGVHKRVAKIRILGNAIDPRIAAKFIEATS